MGFVSRGCISFGDTGLGNGHLDTVNGVLGPVRLMADTPRFLLLSRRGLAPTGAVEEKLEDWMADRVTEG